MKAYYDLHIHSTLSSCSDELQTPNNILNMCMLKGLDIIAITDHNSLKHLYTFEELSNSYNFLFIFGCEVTVKEGFHILTYFETLEKAINFDQYLESNLDKENYDSTLLGRQIICDIYDEEKDCILYYLNKPLKVSFKYLIEKVRKLEGIVILAHINKLKTGILDYIEDISNIDFDGIEINFDKDNLIKKTPHLSNYKIFENSDAHTLVNINERKNYIEIDDLTFSSFKKFFGN